MKINHMYSYIVLKEKFAIHKRFKNRDMYFEFPGVLLNNLELN